MFDDICKPFCSIHQQIMSNYTTERIHKNTSLECLLTDLTLIVVRSLYLVLACPVGDELNQVSQISLK